MHVRVDSRVGSLFDLHDDFPSPRPNFASLDLPAQTAPTQRWLPYVV